MKKTFVFGYLPLKALESDGLMFITERCLFYSRIGMMGMIVLHVVKRKKCLKFIKYCQEIVF